jgi:hypothetical protein
MVFDALQILRASNLKVLKVISKKFKNKAAEQAEPLQLQYLNGGLSCLEVLAHPGRPANSIMISAVLVASSQTVPRFLVILHR